MALATALDTTASPKFGPDACLFREHRGGLAESMATTVQIGSHQALVAHIAGLLKPFHLAVAPEDLYIDPSIYAVDERIGWDTYMVTLKGYGVVGFTNRAPSDSRLRPASDHPSS